MHKGCALVHSCGNVERRCVGSLLRYARVHSSAGVVCSSVLAGIKLLRFANKKKQQIFFSFFFLLLDNLRNKKINKIAKTRNLTKLVEK
jgi:hypothetical protein